eukprot:497565-Hanusia_phi.AAC.1
MTRMQAENCKISENKLSGFNAIGKVIITSRGIGKELVSGASTARSARIETEESMSLMVNLLLLPPPPLLTHLPCADLSSLGLIALSRSALLELGDANCW